MNAIEVEYLWKKFTLTRTHPRGGSLRDVIPQTVGRLFGRNGHGDDTFWALKDISFSVARGEALGIIGPNGAGKSTILKLLAGVLRPDRGTIRINGRVAPLIELGAGFHLDLSGRENVYLNGAILGLKKREIDRKFDEIVEFAGIQDFIDAPVKHYSSGMTVRLGFAVAAHTDPDVLLIDEVLAVGDLAFQLRCFERIRELRRRGVPILFVSHNLYAIEDLCDRVLVLARGQKAIEDEPRVAVAAYRRSQLEPCAPARSENLSPPVGGQPIEILKVTTLDGRGTERSEFETGEPLTVRIEFRAMEPVADPVFGVAIHNLEGVYCYGVNTRVDDFECGDVIGAGAIDVTYGELNLLAGQYRVTAAVFEPRAVIPYDFCGNACGFGVTTARKYEGSFHLDHRWHLRLDRDATRSEVSAW